MDTEKLDDCTVKREVLRLTLVRNLFPILQKRHGNLKWYPPKSVMQAMKERAIPDEYLPLSVCLFASKNLFEYYLKDLVEPLDYGGLRAFIAPKLYAKDPNFSPQELTDSLRGDVLGKGDLTWLDVQLPYTFVPPAGEFTI